LLFLIFCVRTVIVTMMGKKASAQLNFFVNEKLTTIAHTRNFTINY
jgi:hypothetical protein